MESAIMVFTSKSLAELSESGGSGDWVLDPARARRCAYVVCTWNAYGERVRVSGLVHRQGFLVAPITSIEQVEGREYDPKRYIIRFERYARIEMPDLWPELRNPVKYTSLKDLGIDPEALEFELGPLDFVRVGRTPGASAPTVQRSTSTTAVAACTGLSIAQAKLGLATFFGVSERAIEITIRG